MDVVSFTIDHDRMVRGVYLSRQDPVGNEMVSTFDIRLKLPNLEPVLGNPEIHTLEHLMAVYLRSPESGWADKVIYVGPMGCRTGMYLVVKGDLISKDVLPLLQEIFRFMAEFDEAIPATTSRECGNYLDHNLVFAKYEAKKFLEEVLLQAKEENLVYPS